LQTGCLADLTVKPKSQPNDAWLQIQVKTSAASYGFHSSKKYIDCLMLCICWEDKKMWINIYLSMTTWIIAVSMKSRTLPNAQSNKTLPLSE
jgi:hypothetical protein